MHITTHITTHVYEHLVKKKLGQTVSCLVRPSVEISFFPDKKGIYIIYKYIRQYNQLLVCIML